MSDVQVVLTIPAELLERAKRASMDVNIFLLDALEKGVDTLTQREHKPLTREDIEAAITVSIERNASGLYPQRQLGQNIAGFIVSDDFDEPLPDSFWLGEDQ